MFDTDLTTFTRMMEDIWALKTQTLTTGQKAMYFRALKRYPLEQVRAGLDAHICDPQRGRFLPMPADVIAQIEGLAADDGRPGPEEAWAQVLRASDEDVTVVWTAEMSEAWGIARSVMNAGDDVGARMAFKEVYTRLIDAARRAGTPIAWSVSLGLDVNSRNSAIAEGIRMRRIMTDTCAAIGYESTSPVLDQDFDPEKAKDARQRLKEIRDSFLRMKVEKVSRDAKARADTDLRKADAATQVQDYTQPDA